MKFTHKHVKYPLAIVFNILLIIILLAWATHNLHSQQLTQDVLEVNLSSIFIVIILDLVVSLLYGLRLRKLLDVPYLRAWCVTCIGNGLNSILPFRLGDVIRVYCARQYYQIHLDKMIGATLVERSFDLFILLSLGFIAFIIGPVPFGITFFYVLLFLFSCSLIVLLFYRILISENIIIKKVISRFSVISKFTRCMRDIIVNKNKKQLVVMSCFIWIGIVLIYASFFKLNVIDAYLTWQGAIIMCFITTLAFAIPYVAAGIGVFESAVIYYLVNVLHLSLTNAVALALVFHLAYSLPQVFLAGVIFLTRKLKRFHLKLPASDRV